MAAVEYAEHVPWPNEHVGRMKRPLRLPDDFLTALRRWGIAPTRHLLTVSVQSQSLVWWSTPSIAPSLTDSNPAILTPPVGSSRQHPLPHIIHTVCRASTSRFGTGQVENSLQTPLGLHRVARKIGAGCLPGTVFEHRVPVGFTWNGQPTASITQRILWLEGLEPGHNRHGHVDTFRRYIYIHGYGDETTLGKPKSRGCIHMAAADLIPLFDRLPHGSLVWIGMR